MKPVTRKEQFYDAIINGTEAPTPLTREEYILKDISESSGSGGSDVTFKLINEYNDATIYYDATIRVHKTNSSSLSGDMKADVSVIVPMPRDTSKSFTFQKKGDAPKSATFRTGSTMVGVGSGYGIDFENLTVSNGEVIEITFKEGEEQPK